MAELTLSTVVVVILSIIIIIFVFTQFEPARQLFNSVFGLSSSLSKQDAESQSQLALKTFIAEYLACKASPDVSCVCPFSVSALPAGTFIELSNDLSTKTTSLKLFQGTVKDSKSVEYGSSIGNGIYDAKIDNDRLFISSKTPDRSTSYVDGQGRFDLASYYQEAKVFLVGASGSGTPLDVKSSANFNLRGVYRMDESGMVLIPSPSSFLDVAGHPEEKELAKLNGLKKCTLVPDDMRMLMIDMQKRLQDCASIGRLPPYSCAPFNLNIPKGYTVAFVEKTMTLVDQNQKVLSKLTLPYVVCNSPVYADADLASFDPSQAAQAIVTSNDKFATVVVLPQNQVCLHIFSETEVLQGKVDALRNAKQPLLG